LPQLTRRSILLFALVFSLPAIPVFAATTEWAVLDDPPQDIALGAIVNAGKVGGTGTARVQKKKNKVWNASGKITPSAKSDVNGSFTGKIAGHPVSNLPVRKVSALTVETNQCVQALDAIVSAGATVFPKARTTVAALDRAATAVQRAREFAAGSELPDETKAALDENYQNSQDAIAAAREFATGLSRNPTRDQIAKLLGLIGDAALPVQDSFRILLTFEP
jgi:hypothetical protein